MQLCCLSSTEDFKKHSGATSTQGSTRLFKQILELVRLVARVVKRKLTSVAVPATVLDAIGDSLDSRDGPSRHCYTHTHTGYGCLRLDLQHAVCS